MNHKWVGDIKEYVEMFLNEIFQRSEAIKRITGTVITIYSKLSYLL